MNPLNRGAIVEIIAPSGKIVLPAEFEPIEKLLQQWGYRARFGKYLLGDHPFLANTTELRFEDLKNALLAEDSDAIWCYRGGSGAQELLPLLENIKPFKEKLFLGFSDISSLHTFFVQRFGWKSFHGPLARQTAVKEIDEDSFHSVRNLFENKLSQASAIKDLKPFNSLANKHSSFSGNVIGGNLSIISNLCGTPYQPQTDNKILLLEDWNDPAYKVRRMLTQLSQSGLFKNLKALILGEFIQKDPAEQQWIETELNEFAQNQHFPIYRTHSIGHGDRNIVIPFGTELSFSI